MHGLRGRLKIVDCMLATRVTERTVSGRSHGVEAVRPTKSVAEPQQYAIR